MKVRVIFESQGPYLVVGSETPQEDKLLDAAFRGRKLRAAVEFDESYHTHLSMRDERAELRVYIDETPNKQSE